MLSSSTSELMLVDEQNEEESKLNKFHANRQQQEQQFRNNIIGIKPTKKQNHNKSFAMPPSSKPLKRGRLKQLIVVTLLITGLIICVTSLICLLLLPSFVSNQISKRLVLKNNSMLLERWSKPNVPMYFKVWVWDVTNAREIVEKRGTKPRLREIGPFVFHLRRQKDIVSFAGDNLYYTERKIYHFSQELSCCAINTTVTIPNIPLVAVVDRALSYNLPLVGRFIPRLINRAIQSLREQLFIRKQVREILFDGYEVELLKMVSRVGAIVGLPQQNQKFAILKGRNDTWRPEQDGVWAINTGSRDRRQFGRVSSWNSYKQLPFWAAPGCNAINGSDGTLFPPPVRQNEPLYIFNQELCRTVNLVYERPSDIRGIKALRYVLNPMNFAHTMNTPASATGAGPMKQSAAVAPSQPTPRPSLLDDAAGRRPTGAQLIASASEPRASLETPHGVGSAATPTLSPVGSRAEQERFVWAAQEAQAQADRLPSQRNPFTCFCDRKSTNLNGVNVCEFDGLIDLSKCTKQAQVIFGSMPHFHRSDLRLARQVDGMEPNSSKHMTYLDIEPNTGLVLGGKRRVQLNLLIKHNNEVDGFENINDMLVPVVWFEESAMIPEESAQKFKSLYTNRIRLINMVLVSMFLASLVLVAIDLRLLLATKHWREFRIIKLATSGCQSAKAAASATTTTTTTTTPSAPPPKSPPNSTGAAERLGESNATMTTATDHSRTSGLASSLSSQSRRKESTVSTDSCSSSQELTLAANESDDESDDHDDNDDGRQATIATAHNSSHQSRLLINASQCNDQINLNQQQATLPLLAGPQATPDAAGPPQVSEPAQVHSGASTSTIPINGGARNFTRPAKRSVVDLNGAGRQTETPATTKTTSAGNKARG